jgi:hypothetical protein
MYQRTREIIKKSLFKKLSRRCAHIKSNVVVNIKLRFIIDIHAKVAKRINSK